MKQALTAAAFSAALLLGGGGIALAQSSTTHGTTGTTGSTMSAPGTPATGGSMSGSSSSMNSGSATTTASHRITSESQLKQDLEAKGYSDVTNVKHEGDHYTANAKQEGQNVKVRVDANSGAVTKTPG